MDEKNPPAFLKLKPTFTRPLSPLNLLDYMRLLYWSFCHPQRLMEYVNWIEPGYPRIPKFSETLKFISKNSHIQTLILQAMLIIIIPFAFGYVMNIDGIHHLLPGVIIYAIFGMLWGFRRGIAAFIAIIVTFLVTYIVILEISVFIHWEVDSKVPIAIFISLVMELNISTAVRGREIIKNSDRLFPLLIILYITIMLFTPILIANPKTALIFLSFFFLILAIIYFRLPLYFFVLLTEFRRKSDPPYGAKLDGTIWLPFPGIRKEIIERMRANPISGVALCGQYLDYSLQYIPVICSVNTILAEDSTHSHSWCRLFLKFDLNDLIKYGAASLRNIFWNNFFVIIIPRRKRDKWFPRFPRINSPNYGVCAGYISIVFPILRKKDSKEEITESLDKGIGYFKYATHVLHAFEVIQSYSLLRDCLICKTPGEIALIVNKPSIPISEIKAGSGTFVWLDNLTEEELRPELLGALRKLRSIAREVESLTQLTSRAGRLAASARASDTLRMLADEAARECFDPEKTLLQLIIENWKEIVTKAGGEVGRSALPINKIPNNYILGPALRNQQGRLFVGRDDIYRNALRLWSNEQIKQPLLFFGQRRMGKTSILLHMESQLGPQYLPVFLDMQTLATVDSHPAFLYNLADYTASELNKMGLSIPVPNFPDYKEEPFIAFRKFIQIAETKISPDKWVVLMFDEFELVEEKLNKEIFPKDLMFQFRNIMQHHPRFAMVMAGSHRLDEMRRDYWNPLMQIARVIKIGYLSRSAATQLITNPWDDFPIEYQPEAVEKIIQDTGGQPLLIQTICSRILERVNERLGREGIEISPVVTVTDAQTEIEKTVENSEYFPAVFNALPSNAQLLLKSLAKIQTEPDQYISADDVGRDLSIDEKSTALETLKLRDMVDEKDGQIRFTVEMVRQWLIKKGL